MPRPRVALVALALTAGLLAGAGPAGAARDRTAPSTPANLRITASTSTSVTLSWDRSTDNSSNFWYCVQQNGSGCLRVNPPQTTLTRTKLLPDRTHTFAVYAVDAAGNRSATSNTVSLTTPPDTTPPAPAPTLSVTELLPTRVSLAWPQPGDDLSQVWTSLFVNGAARFVDRLGPPSVTLSDLTPSTTYEFQVTIRDAAGNTTVGDALSVTTPPAGDAQPPTAPTNVRDSSSSVAPEILLLWDQATDNVDAQSQLRYDVYFDGTLQASIIGSGRAWMSCVTVAPTEIVVFAVDTSGNVSPPSNTLTFDCGG